MGELEVVFGMYGKFVFYFDWGVFDEFVKVVEVGVMVDVFMCIILIMVELLEVVNIENCFFFINFYVNL